MRVTAPVTIRPCTPDALDLHNPGFSQPGESSQPVIREEECSGRDSTPHYISFYDILELY
jgi:hypothetical protein